MNARFKQELTRKFFHLSGVTVPFTYFFFGRDIAIIYTSTALLGFLILEFIRIRAHSLFPLVKTADIIQRQKEKTAIAAYVYFSIAAVISIYFFNESTVIVGLSAALISDAAAAVFGVRFGRRNIKAGKTAEGSVAGFLTALAIAYVLKANLVTVFALGLVFLFFDLVELGIDDNFTSPLTMVVVAQILGAII